MGSGLAERVSTELKPASTAAPRPEPTLAEIIAANPNFSRTAGPRPVPPPLTWRAIINWIVNSAEERSYKDNFVYARGTYFVTHQRVDAKGVVREEQSCVLERRGREYGIRNRYWTGEPFIVLQPPTEAIGYLERALAHSQRS